MTITLPTEAEILLREEAARERKTPEQIAMEAMIAGLRGGKVPQTLDDLPRRELPAGKTLLRMFEEFWAKFPAEETDEEANSLLEELS